MKISDIKSNDLYLLEGPLDYLTNKFTDRTGDQEFKHYKEGLMNDYIRWANLTAGSKDTNDINLITQWLTSQYGLKPEEVKQALGSKAGQQDQAQSQEEPQADATSTAPTDATATATPDATATATATPDATATATATPDATAKPDTAQADKVKANLAANKQARQGGGNGMDLNKWYQDYQAEQNPQNKLNLVKELVNRVADYGPQDVESMKAILKKIRDPQNTPFINAALQKMSAGKDMAVSPQSGATQQAKPKQPAPAPAPQNPDAGKPGFMQNKLKGVQRPAAPAFTKQTVNNSVMYHVNAIVEALGYTMSQLGYAVLKESTTTVTIYNKSMLTESQLIELDIPRAPSTLGKVAGAVGGAIGGAKGMWQGAKDAFTGQKAAANNAQRADVAGSDVGANADADAAPGGAGGGGAGGGAMGGTGGDVWDGITRLMYKTGRLETNPRNNMKNKMGQWMTKGSPFEFDDTKGMARGGYQNSNQAGGAQGAQGGAPTAPAAGGATSTASGSSGKSSMSAFGDQPQAGAPTAPAAGGATPTPQAGAPTAPAAGGATPTPQAGAPTAPAAGGAPTAPGAADAGGEDTGDTSKVTGTLDANQLAKLLPGVDAMGLARGISDVKAGQQVGAKQKQAFGDAMMALIKADPATTVKVMNSLKQISAGQGAAGKVGNSPATSGFDAKGNAKSESVVNKKARLISERIFKKAKILK